MVGIEAINNRKLNFRPLRLNNANASSPVKHLDVAHSIGTTFVTLKTMHRQNVKYTILQVLTFAYLFSKQTRHFDFLFISLSVIIY